MGNGDAQGCAGSAFGIVGNDIENFYLELLAQGTEDGAEECIGIYTLRSLYFVRDFITYL